MGSLRIAQRALLLLILATARGVYTVLEQPSSSTMAHFPELLMVAANIGKYVSCRLWRTQFLPCAQIDPCMHACIMLYRTCAPVCAPLQLHHTMWACACATVCAQLDGDMGGTNTKRLPCVGHRVLLSVFCVMSWRQ